MLSTPEKILFLLALAASAALALNAVLRLVRIIGRGRGRPAWSQVPSRLASTLVKTVSFTPVFRARPLTSLLHAIVAWGFIYYLLVNLGDVLQGFLPGFVFLGRGPIGNMYRLLGDLFTASVLVGMASLIVRRYLVRPAALNVRDTTLLHPKARAGIQRDSAIVGGFILLHVGGRFLGEPSIWPSPAPIPGSHLPPSWPAPWAGWPPVSSGRSPGTWPGGWRSA